MNLDCVRSGSSADAVAACECPVRCLSESHSRAAVERRKVAGMRVVSWLRLVFSQSSRGLARYSGAPLKLQLENFSPV
jgi:hypothetical protein